MLRSVKELIGYMLTAEDGDIGKCKGSLFDDAEWAVRYMVADTRRCLPGRKVLISPISLDKADWETEGFPVKLTKDQVRGSPSLPGCPACCAPILKRRPVRPFSEFPLGRKHLALGR